MRPSSFASIFLCVAGVSLAACSGGGGSPAAPAALGATNSGSAPTLMNFSRSLDAAGGALNDSTPVVGVRLTGEKVFVSRYGDVLGYFNGTTSTKSEVVHLTAGTNVAFKNVDGGGLPHTVSFLGDATATKAPFPPHFDGSANASKAGTTIGTKNWSTGALNPNQRSRTYNAGAPGFYMVGCAFHYDSNGMRTVIVVH